MEQEINSALAVYELSRVKLSGQDPRTVRVITEPADQTDELSYQEHRSRSQVVNDIRSEVVTNRRSDDRPSVTFDDELP